MSCGNDSPKGENPIPELSNSEENESESQIDDSSDESFCIEKHLKNQKEVEDEDEVDEEDEDEVDEEDGDEVDEEDEDEVDEEDGDEVDEEGGDEVDDEDDDNIMFIINKSKLNKRIMARLKRERTSTTDANSRPKKVSKYVDIQKKYNVIERTHFNKIAEKEQEEIYKMEKELENGRFTEDNQPLRFKILKMNIPNNVKNILISKLEQYNKMMPGSGEYCKLGNWLNFFSKIPIGRYHSLPITNGESDIQKYLKNVKDMFDQSIYGHNETKEQIIRILAQWVSNPSGCGYVIGIQGSPGVGKTKLIKTCITKAMNIPLSFVSLGGISDSSFLNGHNYTYEGATYGKITESLIKAGVMNPVFLFDELDKVSNTSRGEEIINTLIHITDPVQNDRYNDKFFEELDLDLSKSLIIFTYNDEDLINPILKDRMITIRVPGYSAKEKMSICKDYIIPELLPQYNLKKDDVVLEEKLLKTIVDSNTDDGVRNIKSKINNIISWVNMMKYIPTDNIKITFPFTVSTEFFNKYCHKQEKEPPKLLSMYT